MILGRLSLFFLLLILLLLIFFLLLLFLLFSGTVLFDELLLHHYFLFSGRKSLTFGCLLILLEKLLLFGFSAIFGIVFRHFIQILP